MNWQWIYTLISPAAFLVISSILGFITPEYDHFAHTISKLAISEYAQIQQVNFIQFGFALLILGRRFGTYFSNIKAKRIWSRTLYFCAAFILLETIFPTDPVSQFTFSLSLSGIIHFGALALFFVIAPIGVYLLQTSMKTDDRLKKLSGFTGFMGYLSAVLCYIWTTFFFVGIATEFQGLFQKLIGLIVLSWLTIIIWNTKPEASNSI